MKRFSIFLFCLASFIFLSLFFSEKAFAVTINVAPPNISTHLPSPGDRVNVDAEFDDVHIAANQKFVYGVTILPPADQYVTTTTQGGEVNGPYNSDNSGPVSQTFVFNIQAGACNTGSILFQGQGFWRTLTCNPITGSCALNQSGQGSGDSTTLADGIGATETIHTAPSTNVSLRWVDSKGTYTPSGTTNSSGDITFNNVNCNPSGSGSVTVNIGNGQVVDTISALTYKYASPDICNGQSRTITIPIPGTTPTPPPTGGPVCGNGICESGETTASCPQDCPATPPTPIPTPTPTPSPTGVNYCGGGDQSCGGIVTGQLNSPGSNASLINPVSFSGQYWCRVDKCVNFNANPTLSYVSVDGTHTNFTSSEIGNGSFSKSLTLSPGSHTIFVHIEGYSSDRGFNGVVELPASGTNGCCGSGSITVTQPPAAWLPPTCTNTSFSGCSLQGNSRCSDWGSSSYPNWDNSLWNDCQKACTLLNPDNFCLSNLTINCSAHSTTSCSTPQPTF